MGQYSIGEAISLLMERSKWKPKVQELRLRDEWETIVGKTIAKYTRQLTLHEGILTIHTDIAALKQELSLGREQLAARINEHFGEHCVNQVVVK
jgi:Zn-ribbon-containing, possibly RNA-binding protein and truncated derivatives